MVVYVFGSVVSVVIFRVVVAVVRVSVVVGANIVVYVVNVLVRGIDVVVIAARGVVKIAEVVDIIVGSDTAVIGVSNVEYIVVAVFPKVSLNGKIDNPPVKIKTILFIFI